MRGDTRKLLEDEAGTRRKKLKAALLWELEWGEDKRWRGLLKKAEHGEWPKALRDKPEVDDSLASIWRCFWALHNSRSAGFDANPLAASEVLTVLDLFGFEDVEEKQRAFELIKAMDAAYLQKRNERRGDEKRSLPGSNR